METYRSLFERLRTLADHLPPSHVVGERPAERVMSALIHFTEFGEELLDAADQAEQHVLDQLTTEPGQRGPALQVAQVLVSPYPAPADPGQVASDQADQIAALQAQVNALLAQSNTLPKTTASGAPVGDVSVDVAPTAPRGQTNTVSEPQPTPTVLPTEPPADLPAPADPNQWGDVSNAPASDVPDDVPAAAPLQTDPEPQGADDLPPGDSSATTAGPEPTIPNTDREG